MSRYHTKDVFLTDDGDFRLDENKDILLAEGLSLLEQNILIPLKTTNPDWASDAIGADLEDLLGLENSRDTANLGIEKIKNALTQTEFFNEEDIWVEAKPIDQQTILFLVFINSPFSETPLAYEVKLDLGFGSTTRRVY